MRKYFDGTEVLVEEGSGFKRWRRADGKFLLRTASRLHLYPNDSVQTEPDIWGEIEDDGGSKTADHNPSGKGTTLASETNSVNPSYRTYYSHDTSSLGAGATVTDADLTVYIADVSSPALDEGDEIEYKLDFKTGDDFIGLLLTTDDWDGSSNSNMQNWGSSPPSAGSFQMDIDNSHINVDGDTDFELVESCNYVGVASGQAVEFEFDTKTAGASPSFRTYLDVVYTPAAAGGSRNQVSIIG